MKKTIIYNYDNVPHKTCGKCKDIKPLSEFFVCRTNTSGRSSECKKCYSSRVDKGKWKQMIDTSSGKRVCTTCKVEKELTAFRKRKENGHYRRVCSECMDKYNKTKRNEKDPDGSLQREYMKQYIERNYETIRIKDRADNKKRYHKNKKEMNESYVQRRIGQLRRMGITDSEDRCIEFILSNKKVCTVCGNPDPNGSKLAVDHCHTTGKIRDLLCRYCNLALGYTKDNPQILQGLYNYINLHSGNKKEEMGIVDALLF